MHTRGYSTTLEPGQPSFRIIGSGYIEKEIDFLDIPEAIESSEDAAVAANVAFKNVSHIINAVGAGFTGSELAPLEHVEAEPDYVKANGIGTLELEGKCSKMNPFIFNTTQLVGYATRLREHVEQGEVAPGFQYILTRYGKRTGRLITPKRKRGSKERPKPYKEYEPARLHLEDPEKVPEILSETIRYGVIIPSNLMLALAMLGQPTRPSEGAIYKQGMTYKFRFQNEVRLLSRGLSGLGEIVRGRRRHKAFSLFLEDLVVDMFHTPPTKVNGTEIRSFPITRFGLSQSDHKRWLEYFVNNFEGIVEHAHLDPEAYERIRPQEWNPDSVPSDRAAPF